MVPGGRKFFIRGVRPNPGLSTGQANRPMLVPEGVQTAPAQSAIWSHSPARCCHQTPKLLGRPATRADCIGQADRPARWPERGSLSHLTSCLGQFAGRHVSGLLRHVGDTLGGLQHAFKSVSNRFGLYCGQLLRGSGPDGFVEVLERALDP
jgi:hypothetical protein